MPFAGPPPPYANRPNMEKPSSVDFDRFVGVRGAVAGVADVLRLPGVWGVILRSRVWGLGPKVWGLGPKVWGVGFRV